MTFPVNPSVTITSTEPLKTSRPSTLPMKFSPVSFRLLKASFVRSVPYAVGRNPNRGVALATDRRSRRLVHADDLGRVHDLDLLTGVTRVLQERDQLLCPADQERGDSQLAGRRDRAIHVDLRSMISA